MGVNPTLSVGQAAPDFSLSCDDAGTIHLADLRGERVLLYFYPRDNTPGCTTQACDFRDNLARLKALGYTVLGVSPDDLESHATFRQDHDLSFPLLADPTHRVAEAYGVWREKKNYGRTYMGIVRSTFVLDAEGNIEAIYDNVRAKGHVERLIRELS